MPQPNTIEEQLAQHGLSATLVDFSGKAGGQPAAADAATEEQLARFGLSATLVDVGGYAAQARKRKIAEDKAALADDTGRIGQVYGSFVRGITGTIASTAETLGVWAYGLQQWTGIDADRKLEDYALYQLGQGVRGFGEFVTPEESIRYGRSFSEILETFYSS